MKEKIKLLLVKGSLTAGGVDNLVLAMLSELDFDRFDVSLLTYHESPHDWQDKFTAYGCRILKISRARKGPIRFIYNQYRLFKRERFDIVHVHTSVTGFLTAMAAWLAGIKVCICHSHYNEYQESKAMLAIARFCFNVLPCDLAACSSGAGEALFGKNRKKGFTFLKNGIDTEKFAYNETVRQDVRQELGLADRFVVGNVGRICPQKNQLFLLDVFACVQKKMPEAVLLLVGDGEQRGEVEKKIGDLRLDDKVMLLGSRHDVDTLLQGMDMFVFPTVFEGLSMALLEVQASGLYCITSDVVPREVKVSEEFRFVSLQNSAEAWADEMIRHREYQRSDGSGRVRAAGFGKHEATEALEAYYIALLDRYSKKRGHP